MKRMNEVFELPVPLGDAYAYGFATIREAAKIGRCPAAKHAAIAINNVDKLADALEESLAMLFMANNLHYGTGIDDPVIARLRAVLDGYRGAL